HVQSHLHPPQLTLHSFKRSISKSPGVWWCVFRITLFYHDFIMFIFLLSVVFHNVYRLFVYLDSRKYSTKAEETLTLNEAMIEYINMRHAKEFELRKKATDSRLSVFMVSLALTTFTSIVGIYLSARSANMVNGRPKSNNQETAPSK